jgi:hypothetical protein
MSDVLRTDADSNQAEARAPSTQPPRLDAVVLSKAGDPRRRRQESCLA